LGKIEFGKDYHPEFDGYIWERGKGIWISFIKSNDKGKGNFSRLLEEYKSKYAWIKIPTPFPLMRQIACNHGFYKILEYFKEVDENCEVLFWRKKV
jgi:hypothetical protein